MREIKFRVYDIENKEMLRGGSDFIYRDKEGYYITDLEDALKDPKRFKVMQYINIKDKNKKEIYEEDIIKGWRNSIYTVLFVEKRGGYYPFAQGDGCGCCDDEVEYDPDECEVIGNIYENPELAEDIDENE